MRLGAQTGWSSGLVRIGGAATPPRRCGRDVPSRPSRGGAAKGLHDDASIAAKAECGEMWEEVAAARAVAGSLLPGVAESIDVVLDRLLADPDVDLEEVAADWGRSNRQAEAAVDRLRVDAGSASTVALDGRGNLERRTAMALTALGFSVRRVDDDGHGAYEGGVSLRRTDHGLHVSWTTHQSLADVDRVGDARLGDTQMGVMLDMNRLLGQWLRTIGFRIRPDAQSGYVVLDGPPDGWQP